MRISENSNRELVSIFETRNPPAGHFFSFAAWNPLIYGADGPQRIYLDLLLQWYGSDEERHVERFTKANHPFVSNYFIDWTDQGRVSNSGLERDAHTLWDVHDPAVVKQEQYRQSFAYRFNASKSRLGPLAPDALAQDQARTTKIIKGIGKDNPALNPTLGDLRQGGFAHQIKQFAVRRACKFLIYEGIKNKRVVAYALDDLNLDEVANKTPRELDGNPGRFKVPVCTSELREVFRRWDYCSQWVGFFEDLHRVNPPWHRDRNHNELQGWAQYASARASKLAQQVGQQHQRYRELLQVQALYIQGACAQSIEAFHGAKPSEISPLPNAAWDL
jgi:hypothetical protein